MHSAYTVENKEHTRKLWCGLKFEGQWQCCHLLVVSSFTENIFRSNL
ncbi:hypothetical protein E2C01_053347 [Portunus trituberculatus]|uniref:Uncharacterized protein n=1 Tax=Portunus trituberculatus TaxID=210409 RepID=A0A5B7GGC5_PORTR|nr:hypothetical protein [Portunus trituberculatus]